MAGFVQAVFIAAVDQAIRVLRARHTRQAMLLGQSHKFMHAIRALVREADMANLALLDQTSQSIQLLMDGGGRGFLLRVVIHGPEGRHMALGPVNLVEVNHLRLQALQAGIARANNVCGRHARAFANPGHAARRAGHLGGQRELLAHSRAGLEPASDDGLCRAKGGGAGGHGIHFGGVEKVHAALHRAVHDAMGLGLIHLLAKRHGAQTDGADAQVTLTQSDRIHGKAMVLSCRSHSHQFMA